MYAAAFSLSKESLLPVDYQGTFVGSTNNSRKLGGSVTDSMPTGTVTVNSLGHTDKLLACCCILCTNKGLGLAAAEMQCSRITCGGWYCVACMQNQSVPMQLPCRSQHPLQKYSMLRHQYFIHRPQGIGSWTDCRTNTMYIMKSTFHIHTPRNLVTPCIRNFVSRVAWQVATMPVLHVASVT